jgi:hypothetical protein
VFGSFRLARLRRALLIVVLAFAALPAAASADSISLVSPQRSGLQLQPCRLDFRWHQFQCGVPGVGVERPIGRHERVADR